jgi:AraC-like DNA-binding protein
VSADAIGAIALALFVYATALLAVRLPLSYRPAPAPAPKPRYAGSSMSDQQRTAFMASLAASMERDEAWRNGELKLEELAGQTAMTPHELSQLINEACGTNFQDYLNRFRVEALKHALCSPAREGASILDLGVECGFNSKSALNRIFKAQTGMTPTEFRKNGASQIMI